MTTPNNYTQHSSSISTAQRRVGSFARQGKKEKIERHVRSLWRHKTASSLAVIDSNISPGSQITKLVKRFSLNATPFVSLQTRRRGKRSVFKVGILPRARGERKALVALTNSLRDEGAVSKAFSARLARQLEALSPPGFKSRSANTSNSASTIREARDEIHQQAVRAVPTSWLRLV